MSRHQGAKFVSMMSFLKRVSMELVSLPVFCGRVLVTPPSLRRTIWVRKLTDVSKGGRSCCSTVGSLLMITAYPTGWVIFVSSNFV